ncbi:hypothetical protein DEJ30_04010 [Curtobacterium sp. MCPF17_003]|nr:hypothetical protein DEJ30_04010 [Curtobacterium sp. MCPF17_003]PZE63932.1 hypothetical protein DEJ27_16930 [Curtobacterium sp. MCPF17_018]
MRLTSWTSGQNIRVRPQGDRGISPARGSDARIGLAELTERAERAELAERATEHDRARASTRGRGQRGRNGTYGRHAARE